MTAALKINPSQPTHTAQGHINFNSGNGNIIPVSRDGIKGEQMVTVDVEHLSTINTLVSG